MTPETRTAVYRLHVWICQIRPMIWRRFLVRSDSTIADLHCTLQIAFGQSDVDFNLFHIHGEDYGVYHDVGTSFSTNPKQIRLCDFNFRINERFRYDYHFGDGWQHQVRVDARMALNDTLSYPRCVGGERRAPPEDCGGPLAFMAQWDAVPVQLQDLIEDLRDGVEVNDIELIQDRVEAFNELREQLTLDDFDRRAANRRLKQYANHDEAWMDEAMD